MLFRSNYYIKDIIVRIVAGAAPGIQEIILGNGTTGNLFVAAVTPSAGLTALTVDRKSVV